MHHDGNHISRAGEWEGEAVREGGMETITRHALEQEMGRGMHWKAVYIPDKHRGKASQADASAAMCIMMHSRDTHTHKHTHILRKPQCEDRGHQHIDCYEQEMVTLSSVG